MRLTLSKADKIREIRGMVAQKIPIIEPAVKNKLHRKLVNSSYRTISKETYIHVLVKTNTIEIVRPEDHRQNMEIAKIWIKSWLTIPIKEYLPSK